jgi:hypothetical protein
MTELVIGDWIVRQKLRIPHLVESLIEGDVITKCGRRMADEPNSGGPLLLAVMEAGFTSRACQMCQPIPDNFIGAAGQPFP